MVLPRALEAVFEVSNCSAALDGNVAQATARDLNLHHPPLPEAAFFRRQKPP
jgi:hypothetical protein